ncbi:hypothetical protein FPV67DRAFT_1710896 [Lyophyllum atratum]|nr:hypothetical protein FPV67DRAFT_1710896 [Lyophyllum atratum]
MPSPDSPDVETVSTRSTTASKRKAAHEKVSISRKKGPTEGAMFSYKGWQTGAGPVRLTLPFPNQRTNCDSCKDRGTPCRFRPPRALDNCSECLTHHLVCRVEGEVRRNKPLLQKSIDRRRGGGAEKAGVSKTRSSALDKGRPKTPDSPSPVSSLTSLDNTEPMGGSRGSQSSPPELPAPSAALKKMPARSRTAPLAATSLQHPPTPSASASMDIFPTSLASAAASPPPSASTSADNFPTTVTTLPKSAAPATPSLHHPLPPCASSSTYALSATPITVPRLSAPATTSFHYPLPRSASTEPLPTTLPALRALLLDLEHTYTLLRSESWSLYPSLHALHSRKHTIELARCSLSRRILEAECAIEDAILERGAQDAWVVELRGRIGELEGEDKGMREESWGVQAGVGRGEGRREEVKGRMYEVRCGIEDVEDRIEEVLAEGRGDGDNEEEERERGSVNVKEGSAVARGSARRSEKKISKTAATKRKASLGELDTSDRTKKARRGDDVDTSGWINGPGPCDRCKDKEGMQSSNTCVFEPPLDGTGKCSECIVTKQGCRMEGVLRQARRPQRHPADP